MHNVYGIPSDITGNTVRAQLSIKIAEIIKHRRLTQVQAAKLPGIPQPRLSTMLRGRVRGISEIKMRHKNEYLVQVG